MAEVPILAIPPSLAKLISQAGTHRRGMKVLTWGESGGGKSYFLAHFPSPKVVIEAGEGGIQPFLDPASGDVVFTITDPEKLLEAVEFTLKNEKELRSVVFDPLTLIWEDWMDFFNKKFDGDIRGGQWKDVKAPWKLLHRRTMRSSLNVGMSAWMDDVLYEEDFSKSGPGEKGRLNIRPQEKPKVERRIPHNVDLAIQWKLGRDKLLQPLPVHIARVTKVRRPRSIPPTELYIGKTWQFDEKNPANPWEAIVVPILEKWQDGAVDYLGYDMQELGEETHEIEEAAQNHATGRLLMIIKQQTSLEAYQKVWAEKVGPIVNTLDPEHKEIVTAAHLKKKEELLNK